MKHTRRRRLGRATLSVTSMGLGGARLGNLFAELADTEAHDTVTRAWQEGIRLFDTAPFYGHGDNERRMGESCASTTATASFCRPRSAGCSSRARPMRSTGAVRQDAAVSAGVRLFLRRGPAILRGKPATHHDAAYRHPSRPRRRRLDSRRRCGAMRAFGSPWPAATRRSWNCGIRASSRPSVPASTSDRRVIMFLSPAIIVRFFKALLPRHRAHYSLG